MKVLVIGAGKSGLAAAKLCKDLAYNVFLTESKPADKITEASGFLKKNGIPYEFGKNSVDNTEEYDLVITSPGVPPHAEIIKNAEKKGIKIVSELEFAAGFLKNPIIAVTGTNGKTTTTALTAFIFNNSGKKAIACGNNGNPLSALVNMIEDDVVLVVEVSSYQLSRIDKFAPQIAVLLNLTPDHLEYHGNVAEYFNSKLNITQNQTENNYLILNKDDKELSKINIPTKAKKLYFSLSPVESGIYVDGEKLKFSFPNKHKEEDIMMTHEINLPGIHNRYNSMAAALAARVMEVNNEDIRDSLIKFKGVEHRLEHVKTLDNVIYINDSKATNINATWYALISYDKPVVWLAGGRGDSNDYSDLDEVVEKNVKSVITFGEESENIFNHFCTMKRCRKSLDLEDAVKLAKEEAETGDVVLFSPSCKSFDMFINFEHRGDVFKQIVNAL